MTLSIPENTLPTEFNKEKIDLLKATICKGSTDQEFQLFVHACKRTGLDPFMKQIHAVKRWDNSMKREVMSIQVGIDGYRLIAERTGKYAPGRKTEYEYDPQGALVSATAYVKKQTSDGTWHEVSATAFYEEYVATNKEGKPTNMWATKKHIMLAKCAEASALRKAFPAELSGIYTPEEMQQADNKLPEVVYEEWKNYTKIDDELVEPVKVFIEENTLGEFNTFQEYLCKYCNHYKEKMPAVFEEFKANPEKAIKSYFSSLTYKESKKVA